MKRLLILITALLGVVALIFVAPRIAKRPSNPLTNKTPNLTTSITVVKLSYNEYEQNSRKFRDYVATLRNDGSRAVLVYRIALHDPGGQDQAVVTFPVYNPTEFGPGATVVKHVARAPAEYSFELNAAVLEGGALEGDQTQAKELQARLRASAAKLRAISARLNAVSPQVVAGEIENDQRRLSAAIRNFKGRDADALFALYGEGDALSAARGFLAGARPQDGAARAQKINERIEKAQ